MIFYIEISGFLDKLELIKNKICCPISELDFVFAIMKDILLLLIR